VSAEELGFHFLDRSSY